MPVSYDVGNVFLSKLLALIFVIGADSILERIIEAGTYNSSGFFYKKTVIVGLDSAI